MGQSLTKKTQIRIAKKRENRVSGAFIFLIKKGWCRGLYGSVGGALVVGLIFGQGCRIDPQSGCMWEVMNRSVSLTLVCVCVSLSLSCPPSL